MSLSECGVDCEYHVLVDDLADLLPYLDRTWSHRLTTSEFRLPPAGPHPGLEIEARRLSGAIGPSGLGASVGDDVTSILLVPSQPLVTSGWLSHELAQRFGSAVNDLIVDRWLPADERCSFAIAVQPHDCELAAAEIRRLGSNPRAAAVVLSTIRVNLGQRHHHPIYEAATEYNLPVIVHPGGFEGTVAGPAELGGVGPYTPEEVFSLIPQVATSNLASLIYSGTFTQFPDLKVVFAGFGFGWAVSFLWRADAEWRNLRGEVPWLTKSPSAYVADRVRFVVDGAADVAPATGGWKLGEMLPPSVLVWGSDRPFARGTVVTALEGVSDELATRIACTNAQETFVRLTDRCTVN